VTNDILQSNRRSLDVVIPFYRNPGLVAPLFKSLREIQEELRELSCHVVAINDSPDDGELKRVLAKAISDLAPIVPSRLIENERNLGFVRSVNLAARQAVANGNDVLLLNSDTIVFPGALREISKTAWSDPLIGFVSPRSNNATICTFPQQHEFQDLDPNESHLIFQQLSRYLPESHLVPTAVGFCLFIKQEVLDEFGYFDEAYGQGYNEENDLVMRANRCGYRAALANRGFVYHVGESSFSISSSPKKILEEKNAEILKSRYPEYTPSVNKYFQSEHYQAECLLTGLLPNREGRLDVVFDLTSVGPYHNGTFEACKEILFRAAKIWRQFNLFVMASEEAVRFHHLDELERVFIVPPSINRKFALALRFGQPFSYEHLFHMSRMAVLNVYGMLDPIAYDCLYLNNVDLDTIWGAVFDHADGVIYISDFVEDQFRRRFRIRHGLQELVAYLSLDYRDYTSEPATGDSEGSYILVIGNSFAHKRVPATVDALSSAFPREKIVVLGVANEQRQNVISYQSGHLSEKQMDRLLREARIVIFPSVYEGFGFPVVRSLAYGKPILARSIPTNQAIREKLGAYENLILYSSTRELVEKLRRGFPKWSRDSGCGGNSGGWEEITEKIGQFLCGLTRSVSFNDVLLPRLKHMRLLEEKQSASSRARAALKVHFSASPAASNGIGSDRSLTLAPEDPDARIADIYRSWSWRLTAPMRSLGSAYLRLRNRA
jgi:GT2 family glycosyltransferase/glycosyltransferase involved in cell wall biosynthesis